MFDFPNSPVVGQVFTPTGGPSYTWNGTGWTLSSSPLAGVLNQQVFTASGTYTPTPGMATAIIECVGGGGGGSGVAAAAQLACGGGGGAGGYSRKFVTAAQVGASQVVTIGAAGAGGASGGANGTTAGGDTSVGTICIAKGARGNTNYWQAGAGGLVGTGDLAVGGSAGESGLNATSAGPPQVGMGQGGNSYFGGAAGQTNWTTSVATPGNNASGYGSGGSGGISSGAGAAAGGAGSGGIVIVTEYAAISQGTQASTPVTHTGGFINKFRNGTMDVAQRGTGGTVTSSGALVPTLDGWMVTSSGAATSWSQQYYGTGGISGSALRINGNSGQNLNQVIQRIESNVAVQLLGPNKAAQPVTVQFTIANQTGNPITPQLQTFYPTARDNFASTTADLATVSLQTLPPGAVQPVAYTFVPSVNCELGYEVRLIFPNPSLNIVSGYVDISYADIRATPGLATGLNNSPPPPELRPIATELANCLRHFWAPPANWIGIWNGTTGSGTTVGSVTGSFPAVMRAVPSVAGVAWTVSATAIPTQQALTNASVTYSSLSTVSGGGGSAMLNAGATFSAEL